MAPKTAKKGTVASPKRGKATAEPTGGETEPRSATDSLLSALIAGAPVAASADEILKMYREDDADAAMTAIVNVVCKAAGVHDVEIDGTLLHQEGTIVTTLEELFARVPQATETSSAYFLVNKDPKYRRFRKTLPEFFERLVIVAYAGDVLFDNVLFPTVLQWLIAMTESKARSFRHTSIVAILGLMQGINDRIVYVKDAMANLKKKDAAKSQKTFENLLALQEHIFTSAVHQRVKDVASEIRIVVLQALKEWCVTAPDVYVTNKYLRYFSIAIYDKKPEMRAEGLESIIQIIANQPSAAGKMRDFLKYFAERFVEMVNDVDSRCADLAIKVCALIIRADSEAGESEETVTLNNDMIDRILLSLFDDRSGIRSTAGTFLKVFIRCRVDSEEENANQVKTELLCTFASIFRTSYHQEQPEKYLVDALWKSDAPPPILTEYKPILDLAVNGEEAEAVVALNLIAALLGRLKQPLSFGPPPRDDVKVSHKIDAAKEAESKVIRVKLSKDIGVVLSKILEKHNESVVILSAVADVLTAIDFNVFTTSKESERFCEAIVSFRKIISQVACTSKDVVTKLIQAWSAIAFTEYPQQDTAKTQLNELMKQSLSQLQAAERSQTRSSQELSQKANDNLQRIWSRLWIISSLIPLKDQWILLKNAFTRYAKSKTSPAILAPLIPIAAQGVLWLIAELEVDPSLNPDSINEEITDVTNVLLDVAAWDVEGTRDEPEVLAIRGDALNFFCDLSLLPYATLTQQQQETYVELATELFDSVHERVVEMTDGLRDSIKHATPDASSTSPVFAARSVLSKWEACLSRISLGLARLFALQKVSDKLAPSMLLLWTRSQVKVVADVFKSLFHTVRDRKNDSFGLEKDILLAAYKHCAEHGSNAAGVEALYQVGLKLSSMHFVPTDKYYPACVDIVRWGVEFAATVDPTILNAISPFCCRLRQSDALSVANSLHLHEVFVSATSTYAQAFISAIRRAAKLEDATTNNAASLTPWRSAKKRSREVASGKASEEQPDELLAEITRANTSRRAAAAPSTGRGARSASKASPAPPARVVTADGWRIRPDDEPVMSQASARRGGANSSMPGTQESLALSNMLAELDDEVFVATQEFE